MATDWQIGDRIQNRWEIHKILRGGMGIVYIAYDHEWKDVFALKTFQEEVFARNPAIAQRFKQEARAWLALDLHQNVTEARYVENIRGKPFLFLEYVAGGDLSRWIGTPSLTEDLPQVLRFAIQFCDGMQHAISKGIGVHRDIKPQNCLITQDRVLKVTDFGLAKVLDAPVEKETGHRVGLLNKVFRRRRAANRLAEPGAIKDSPSSIDLSRTRVGFGTSTHMAPEQFDDAKHVDVRADVYSFGVMLFQMAVGHLPFGGRTHGDFERAHKLQRPPRAGSQSALDAVIEKCLAKNPLNRFSEFAAIRHEIADIYRVLTGHSAPPPAAGQELDALQLVNKGASLSKIGRHKEALVCLDRSLELKSDLLAALLNKGAALGGLDRYDEEVELMSHALTLYPESETLWLNKGAALRELDRREEAIACYDRALEIKPRYPMALCNKGAALHELDRIEEAIACYDQALTLDPLSQQAWHNKGNLYLTLGRLDAALDSVKRAVEISPTANESWSKMADILNALGQHMEVVACCDRMLALNPKDAIALANKGNALNELGRHAEGLLFLDRALELDPEFAEAWYDKGNSLWPLGNREGAEVCYRRAVTLEPGNWKAWCNLGAVLNELDRNHEAISCYDRALGLSSKDAKTWANKGNALNALGQHEAGVACYDRALDIDPTLIAAWFNKGLAFAASARFSEAIKCLEKARELGDSEATGAIAWCQQQMKRTSAR
ncbi:MAG TPA: serine/threonine-protein kinase [Blastocatellia bacterium]|nr:serine/threonine-protein kinase [Blastocatellia bacterium]